MNLSSTDSLSRCVRVFISSTFKDMHAERDHLVTVVFPELRERCERLGLEFFDVDLRWGVPEKGVDGEQANSWNYCRQWIDRVEPFFVCILGQRYGWVPSPEQLRDEADQLKQRAEKRSITDMEVRHAVLDTRRKRRSYFYLRSERVPAPDPSDTKACEVAAEFVDPPEQLAKLDALKNAIRSTGRPVREYPCRWTGQGFRDLENFGRLVLEDLWSGILRDERYVHREVWRQALGVDPDQDPHYTDESASIPEDIAAQIVAMAKPLPKDPLDAEREQMQQFADSRLRWFQGRTRELNQLIHFIHSKEENAPRLAVVRARPGQGKSALMAKLSQSLQLQEADGETSIFLVSHFVGATELSSNAHLLVRRLLEELDRGGIAWLEKEIHKDEYKEESRLDINSQCLHLAERLGGYMGNRRVVLLIDGLNQLIDGLDLHWLPERLGPAVRIIVSCADDPAAEQEGPEHQVLSALESRDPLPLDILLGDLGEDEVRTIITEYLREYCKELDPKCVETICAMPQARNPLYLLVMLGELRTLGGNEMNKIVPRLITSMAHDHPDPVSLFRWVLERMEVFGAGALRWWCLYLAAGRVGMASHELADLLAKKLGASAAATALLVERGLRRYLQRRGGQLDFFHGQLRQAVVVRYGSKADIVQSHREIAAHFRSLADPADNHSWKSNCLRAFSELAFHLTMAEELDLLCNTLSDLCFVETRCKVGQVFDLMADYRLAQENLPEARADLEKERAIQEETQRWIGEIIANAEAWNDRRDRFKRNEPVNESEPILPKPPVSCRMWSNEEIQAECERIINSPARRDRLSAFADFVASQCYPLSTFGSQSGFVLQHAFNYQPAGPVHRAAAVLIPALNKPHLLRLWSADAEYNPKSALLLTLEGHTSSIYSVSITPDGRRAVSGSLDNTVRVWDLESGQCLPTMEGHSRLVYSVSITPDGRRAVSGSKDNTVRVWDLKSGVCLRTLEGHSRHVEIVNVTADGRKAISGSFDETLRIWDLESGECLRTMDNPDESGKYISIMPQGQRAIRCLSMTADGRRAVSTGSDRKSLLVWNLENGLGLRTLKGHSEDARSVCVTPDGRRAVSGSMDKTLRVWDLESGQCLRVLTGHSGSVYGVSMTPDGRRAVSGSSDNTLRVWDLEDGQCLRTLKGHSEDVRSVCVTPDGRRAVSGGDDRTLRMWDLERGRLEHRGHSSRINCLSVTPDGQRAVSGSMDKTLRVWDMESGQCLHTLRGHDNWIESVSLMPDGKRALSSGDETLCMWDLESGKFLRRFTGHNSSVGSVNVSPDGRRAISGDMKGCLRVWDLESGNCLHTIEVPKSGYGSVHVAVIPDGRRAISWKNDDSLRIWDLESGRCLHSMPGHVLSIPSLKVTPDGRRVVLGNDKVLRVWDLEKGQCQYELEGDSDYIECMDLSPDGRRAVTGGRDKILRVWDLEKGQCLIALEGHRETITVVAITQDGRLALSASEDNTLRVWDLNSASCLALLPLIAPVSAMATASGRIVIGTSSGSIHILTMRGVEHGPNLKSDTQPDSSDEGFEQLLRCGLDISLREKGDDHEETLNHLKALSVHLGNMDKAAK